MALIFLGLGVSDTVFWGVFITGSVLGGGMAITSSIGAALTSFFGFATGLAGDFDTTAGAGPEDGGPGNETKLTLMDPGENLGLGTDAGQNTTEQMKIKCRASDMPKYSTMVRETAPAPMGYA